MLWFIVKIFVVVWCGKFVQCVGENLLDVILVNDLMLILGIECFGLVFKLDRVLGNVLDVIVDLIKGIIV